MVHQEGRAAHTELTDLLDRQRGVVARRQAIAAGQSAADVRRLLRRREWVTVHPGVYVDHTGDLTWLQRAWAGVLLAWPAALSHESSLRAFDGPGRSDEGLLHLAVDRDRRIAAPAGIRIHRTAHLWERTQWNLGPPRTRYEEAALDVAITAGSELRAIGALATASQSRRTTARRMADALASRPRSPRREWLRSVLDDVSEGACSVLEHAYLTRVERAHALPVARRQVRVTATMGLTYRDATYGDLTLELDGRLFHDTAAQRDRDMDRDLDTAVDGGVTIRLGYGQVLDRPCRTAARVGAVLRRRGWSGVPASCGPGCALDDPAWRLGATG